MNRLETFKTDYQHLVVANTHKSPAVLMSLVDKHYADIKPQVIEWLRTNQPMIKVGSKTCEAYWMGQAQRYAVWEVVRLDSDTALLKVEGSHEVFYDEYDNIVVLE